MSITFGARWHGGHLVYVLNMANPNSETVPSIFKIPRGTLGQLYLYISIRSMETGFGIRIRSSQEILGRAARGLSLHVIYVVEEDVRI